MFGIEIWCLHPLLTVVKVWYRPRLNFCCNELIGWFFQISMPVCRKTVASTKSPENFVLRIFSSMQWYHSLQRILYIRYIKLFTAKLIFDELFMLECALMRNNLGTNNTSNHMQHMPKSISEYAPKTQFNFPTNRGVVSDTMQHMFQKYLQERLICTSSLIFVTWSRYLQYSPKLQTKHTKRNFDPLIFKSHHTSHYSCITIN